jgi:predicted O-methyltransferase YrrM
MNGQHIGNIPTALPDIERETVALGFDMPSQRRTGAFLRTLAASKPAGRLLELGSRSDCHLVRMNWASGLVVACRTA